MEDGITVPRVMIQARNVTSVLGAVPVIVPAGQIILIFASARHAVRLDGEASTPVGDTPALLAVDMTRSVGFHRLDFAGHTFWFGTEDSKLALDGIEHMLQYLREYHFGTTWHGQILFSSGELLRDPHVVYGWLENHAEALLDTALSITRRPVWGAARTQKLSRHAGPGVISASTHALLRANPQRYLEADPSGVLSVADQRYNPLRVVSRRRITSLQTVAHLRLTALLDVVASLIREVDNAEPDEPVRLKCQAWYVQTRRLLASDFFFQVRRRGTVGALLAARSPVETSDSRYQLIFQIASSLRRNFGWDATRKAVDRYAYVRYADQIYQAFVSVAIAAALDCQPTDPVTGRAPGAAFAGGHYRIYADRVPPAELLRSWRHWSSTPDQLRPDLVIERLPDRRTLLLDAKYRASGNRATEDSRREVMSYMEAFGLSTAVIVYPPADAAYSQVTVVEGSGQRLIELPLRPHQGMNHMLSSELPDILRHLNWGRYLFLPVIGEAEVLLAAPVSSGPADVLFAGSRVDRRPQPTSDQLFHAGRVAGGRSCPQLHPRER
jgi:hypothetical protein